MDIYTRAGAVIGKVTAIDATPTENSTNAVQSGGVYTAIAEIPTGSGGDITKASKNLFDKDTAVLGDIDATGIAIQSTDYYVSDFVDVDHTAKYVFAKGYRVAYYGADKTFVSRARVYSNQPLSVPDTAIYMRLVVEVANIDTAICADVRYYTAGVTSGEEITGVTSDLLKATREAITDYADMNADQFAIGKNLFDYDHDFVQVTKNSVGGGVNQTNGGFDYKADTIVNDADITGVFIVGMDKYYPVNYGQIIATNKYTRLVVFYDSDKNIISVAQNRYAYQGVIAPQNSAYARINLQGNPNDSAQMHSLSEIKDIIVWTADVVGSNDLLPTFQYPQFYRQIDGNSISPNYLDKVIPNMVESQFLSAMRCMAIREINTREHAWRFGNFNMWVMASTKGWDMTKKMLMDYGVDFCGFEECVINQSTAYYKGIAEFLHGWQFPYGFYTNWTDGAETQIDKSFVSRFPVTSSAKLSFASASSNASYLNCKVQLPRYQDVYDAFRVLSVYVVHFPITTPQNKVEVATELLSVIANDASDFVIIMGDTNDFGTTDETKDYWVTLEAGGFKPTIPITTKTVTEDGFEQESSWASHCIDQFLVSDNIEMVSYGVVNTKDEYAVSTISGAGTNNEPALSDHDFVWCDLKFDYSKTRSGLVQSGG